MVKICLDLSKQKWEIWTPTYRAPLPSPPFSYTKIPTADYCDFSLSPRKAQEGEEYINYIYRYYHNDLLATQEDETY